MVVNRVATIYDTREPAGIGVRRAAKYSEAEEFATKYILQPPTEAGMLELLTPFERNKATVAAGFLRWLYSKKSSNYFGTQHRLSSSSRPPDTAAFLTAKVEKFSSAVQIHV